MYVRLNFYLLTLISIELYKKRIIRRGRRLYNTIGYNTQKDDTLEPLLSGVHVHCTVAKIYTPIFSFFRKTFANIMISDWSQMNGRVILHSIGVFTNF